MPRPRLPIPWIPVSVIAFAGATYFLGRFLRESVGNPFVAAEEGGPYRVLQFLRIHLPFGPRLATVASIDRPHATMPQWILERILIAPGSDRFAVEESELIAGSGVDVAVTLYAMNGYELFFTTDNGFPVTSYSGTDPSAPLAVRQEQEVWDGYWEEEKLTNPSAPRPVVTGRFTDDGGVGTIRVAGWLANGDMALTGQAPVLFSYPDGNSAVSGDLESWWGIVSPAPPGDDWAFSLRGAGPLPPNHAIVPMPAKQRNVTLSGGQILVDGTAETGFAPILALDGPYQSVNS